MTLACCLVLAARAPNRWERSRNVAWNQWFHKLRSYRGLMGPAPKRCAAQRRRPEKELGGAYMAVFAMCASSGCFSSRRTHIERPVAQPRTHRKRRDVCATRGWFWLRERAQLLGNEAGMWPGINGFTNCAPIADWSGRANEMRHPSLALGEGAG